MIAHLVHAGERVAARALRSIIRQILCRFVNPRSLGAGLLLFLGTGRAAAVLTVAPSSISNSYNGAVTLTITGLTSPGQRVIVEKFFDWDNSSTINAGDQLMQRFKVTDGQVTNVAGRRNINVPGDDDATASVIQTRLYFTPEEIAGRLDGRFIFRVSPDGAGFAPFSAALMVTQENHGNSGLSGRVMAGAAGQSGALVLVTSGAPDDFDVVGVTKTDATGNYSLKLPPGYYRPIPVKAGYVFHVAAASTVNVSAGTMATVPDAQLTAGTRTIAGTVRDDATPVPTTLGGMLVFGFGSTGTFTLTFADASGNYVLDAVPGSTEVGVLETQCATMGVMHAAEYEETGTGNVTGFHLTLSRPTGLIYGTVRNTAGNPVPWLDVFGELDQADEMEIFSITDASGNYSLGIAGTGTWNLDVETPGYLSSGQYINVTAANTAVLHDFNVTEVTAYLRGTVRDNLGAIVPNLEILAHDYSGATAWGYTDAGGNFSLGVHGGPGGTAKRWDIQVNQGGDEPATHVSSRAEFQVTDGNDINGINYLAYLVTAHIRGTMLDENDAPVGNRNVYASLHNGNANALSGSEVEGDGTFDIPVFGGTWQVGLSGLAPSGFIVQEDLMLATTDNSDLNGVILRLRRTTGSISGTLTDTSNGAGISGIRVMASTTVSGASFSTFADTTATGAFSLPVFPGTWSVRVDANGLDLRGYQPVPTRQAEFTTGNLTLNFSASPDSGGTSFDSWQSTNFTPAEIANPTLSGPNADFDGDGVSNFLEFALNLAPKLSDADGLPQPGQLPGAPGGGQYLTLTFTRRLDAPGLSYNVIEAPHLSGPWTNVTSSYEVVSTDGATETVRARTTITSGAPGFMRLQVTQQP